MSEDLTIPTEPVPETAPQRTTKKKPTRKETKAVEKAAAIKARGKPAKKVDEFRQVLSGTKRSEILKLMDGKRNAEQIGDKLGIPALLVSSNVFCLWRDCGIGYSYGSNKELTALFPGKKTVADAIRDRVAAEAKTVATQAKAKKPAAKKTKNGAA